MKVSVREGAFKATPADLPLEQGFERLAKMGYDGVELSVIPDRESRGVRSRRGVWPARLDKERRAAIRAAATKAGLEIPTLSSDWAWAYSEFHPTLDGWRQGAEYLVEDARLAADLGAKVVLMHFGVSTGGWDQVKGTLKDVVAETEKSGVVLGYEGSLWHLNGLGGQPDLVRMVDEIGSPGLQIYAHPSGATQKQVRDIEEVGDRLAALHASAVDPEVDYGRVFAALKRVGYDWYWCFEVAEDLFESSKKGFDELARKHGSGS